MTPKFDADLSALHKDAVETKYVPVALGDAGAAIQKKVANVMKKNKKLGLASCGSCDCG